MRGRQMRSLKFPRSIQTAGGANLSISAADLAVYTCLILIGVFQLTHYPRTADFVADATYPDLARSIVEQGSYQIRFLPQTTLPPGFPFILAVVGWLAGWIYPGRTLSCDCGVHDLSSDCRLRAFALR